VPLQSILTGVGMIRSLSDIMSVNLYFAKRGGGAKTKVCKMSANKEKDLQRDYCKSLK